MVLVCVLSGLGLLSLVAVSLLSVSDVSYRLARTTLDGAQAEAVAEAAVSRAVLALLDPRMERRWRVDGVAQPFAFEKVDVRVTIQDELGRIDLNHADATLLIGLFQSVGLDQASASKLVNKILDWREMKAGKRLNGAAAQDYLAAGLDHRPRGGPFQSVEELRLIMDMTEQLFQQVEPALTVYSGRPSIDPQFAPREALRALPTTTVEQVASTATLRTNPGTGVIPPLGPLGGRAFTIRAEIQHPSGRTTRDVVVRLTDNPLQPHWVLAWKAK